MHTSAKHTLIQHQQNSGNMKGVVLLRPLAKAKSGRLSAMRNASQQGMGLQ
jgi:hypothetical protein